MTSHSREERKFLQKIFQKINKKYDFLKLKVVIEVNYLKLEHMRNSNKKSLTTVRLFGRVEVFLYLWHHRHYFDFDRRAFGEGFDCHSGACRVWFGEEFRIDGIHISEIGHVGHENCCFHHILH